MKPRGESAVKQEGQVVRSMMLIDLTTARSIIGFA